MAVLLLDTFAGTANAKLSARATDFGLQWFDEGATELRLDGSGYAHLTSGSDGDVNVAQNPSGVSGAFRVRALVRIIATSGNWSDSACMCWCGDGGGFNNYAGIWIRGPTSGTGSINVEFRYGYQTPFATHIHEITGVTLDQEFLIDFVADESGQRGYCYVNEALVHELDLSAAGAPLNNFDFKVSLSRDTTTAQVFKFDYVEFSDEIALTPAGIDSAPRRFVADVTTDAGTVRLPISSWQSTLNVGTSNYATISVPAAHLYSDTLAATTDFAITWIMLDDSGAEVFEYPMFSAPAQTITYDSGPYRSTATLSGYWPGYTAVQHPDEALDRTLAGVRQQSVTGTSRRYRCSIDHALRPAQRAWHDGLRFLVDRISYYASAPSQGYMDVSVSPEVFDAAQSLSGAILITRSAQSFADAAIQTTPTASASLDAQIDVP